MQAAGNSGRWNSQEGQRLSSLAVSAVVVSQLNAEQGAVGKQELLAPDVKREPCVWVNHCPPFQDAVLLTSELALAK